MPMSILGKERLITENEMGKIYEQKVSLKSCYGEIYDARLIIVKLTKKTRNNDSELSILSNLPEEIADALTIAEIYRKRWGIETAFQRLEAHFNSEINSLGYPKAALFGFCLALVAFNIYAVIMASLRVAHPKVNIKEEVSEYYIAEDISTVYEGMIIAVDDDEWNRFRHLSDAAMIVLLIYLAKQVNLKKFKKNKRGVKKEKPPIKFDKKTPHVSTFKLLLNPA
ncbi:MAG: transposase [Candidatus Competibacteraceae bacterium]|nr:transposase [Candidatus Competibacteraceae bacterium]